MANEYVTFKDSLGAVITTLNTGPLDYADFTVILDGSTLGDMVGTINLVKAGTTALVEIGKVSYTKSTKLTDCTFYAGSSTYVSVNNGDKFTIAITSPSAISVDLPVTRFQPTMAVLNALQQWAGIARLCSPNYPALSPHASVRKTIEAIAGTQATFAVKNINTRAEHLSVLKTFFNGGYDKPPLNILAYSDAAELSNALSTNHPPTLLDVFNSWDRFSADAYYPGGSGATGDSAAWTYDETTGSVVQPNNTTTYVGFTSSEAPDTYDLEVTCTSADGDDDFITVVMAYYRDKTTNQNHTLDLVMCGPNTWATPTRNPWPTVSVARDFGKYNEYTAMGPRYKEYFTQFSGSAGTGWSGRFRRVKVSRRGDIFTTQVSDWGSVTYNPDLTHVLNINDYSELAIFKGGSPYGYGSLSQPKTTYRDITYISGDNQNIILDMANNQVYLWDGSTWVLQNGMKVTDLYTGPRDVISTGDGNTYRITADGQINKL